MMKVPSILDEIVATKHREIAVAKARLPLLELEHQVREAVPVRDFRAMLAGPGPIRLIAEVKKASAKEVREEWAADSPGLRSDHDRPGLSGAWSVVRQCVDGRQLLSGAPVLPRSHPSVDRDSAVAQGLPD